ncbi:MAG: NAD(P)/FAD-dependent oxidoreductase [Saprospiraceae bacterium]
MITTDILIIGAGPCGLFTVFEAGLLKLHCHILDVLPQPGGQLTEIYPKKPIYDIPGFPEILAADLVQNLVKQIEPFHPGFTLGERAEAFEKDDDGAFIVTTNRGNKHKAPVIVIAGGLGCFEPRKPPIQDIERFEDHGIDYFVKDPTHYAGKDIVIAGGGDSALDWSIYLAESARSLTLIHRRTEFRGALDSVEKVHALAVSGKIKLVTEAQVIGLKGDTILTSVVVKHDREGILEIDADYFIPLFGLTPKLGPILHWGLNIDNQAISVNTVDYSTNIPGVYAIGDINTYPGKLKLILCGFHEATLMCQSAFKYIYPDKKLSFKYTTVTGINELK